MAVARAEDPECTFKPTVRPLPAHYGGNKNNTKSDAPVEDRVNRWHEEKQERAVIQRQARLEQEVDGCTFKPQINSNSRRAMAMSRYGDERSAPERLFDHSEQSREIMDRCKETRQMSEEQQFRKTHTFKPKTNTRRVKADPKYHMTEPSSTRRSSMAPSGGATEEEEHTYRPKTNKVKPGTHGPCLVPPRVLFRTAAPYLKPAVPARCGSRSITPSAL